MYELTITGASDDLIEIDGQIRDEFNVYLDNDESVVVAVSDGTAMRVRYDQDGIWRITALASGTATLSKTEGVVADDTFDVITLKSDTPFTWVTCGKDFSNATK